MKRETLLYFVIIGLVVIVAFFIGVFFFSNSNYEEIISYNSSECDWENLYQGLFGSASVYRDIRAGSELSRGGFVVPLGVGYDKIEFKKFGVIASTTENDSRFILNNVDCGALTRNTFIFNDFSATCLNALKEGFNSFNNSQREVIVHEIYVGMRYKPMNCDK